MITNVEINVIYKVIFVFKINYVGPFNTNKNKSVKKIVNANGIAKMDFVVVINVKLRRS